MNFSRFGTDPEWCHGFFLLVQDHTLYFLIVRIVDTSEVELVHFQSEFKRRVYWFI